jgi:glucose-1-phosphate adenylyltransferase
MNNTVIGEGAVVDKAIIAENVVVGNNVELGVGEEAENDYKPQIYSFGLVTIGEGSTIPDNVKVGKNTAIHGPTEASEYPDGLLKSGSSLIKVGDLA